MRIVLLTQDDPFYLPKNLDYLLKSLPIEVSVVGAVVFKASPFGKKLSFVARLKETIEIFGWYFLVRYGLMAVYKKMFGSSMSSVLAKHQVNLIQLEKQVNHDKSLNLIGQLEPDLLVSIAGNQIFKQPLIDLAPMGCLNLHTALLPKYRGLMPSFWVLRFNEIKTGVSVFFVDEGIDSGPIIVQKGLEIGSMSQAKLIRVTKKMGMDAIVEAVIKITHGNYELIPNNQENSSYYSFPTKEDVKVFRSLGKKFY